MSKYKAPWKEFDLNKDFWAEVLVGRKIDYYEPEENPKKVRTDSGMSLQFPTVMILDSGERVWTGKDVGLEGLYPTGRTITGLGWGDEGIRQIILDKDSKIVLPSEGPRICIQD